MSNALGRHAQPCYAAGEMSREFSIDLPTGPTRVLVSGEGPALIWAHGLFHPTDVEDRTLFGRVLSSLRGVRVIRFDTRGYGPVAPAPEAATYRWDRLGDDVLALADAFELETFVAAGFSMGAAASLHAAVRSPARLRGLVLLAPPNGWELRPPQSVEFLESARLLREQGIDAVLELFGRFLEKRPNPPGMTGAQEAMLERLKSLAPGALEGILLGAAASDLPPREALRALALPALVYAFENDPGHPVQVAQELAEVLPRSTLRSLTVLDDAELVTREVQAFLDALS